MINELHAEYSVDEDNNEEEDEDSDVMMVVTAEEQERLVIVFAHCLKAVESCVYEDGRVSSIPEKRQQKGELFLSDSELDSSNVNRLIQIIMISSSIP